MRSSPLAVERYHECRQLVIEGGDLELTDLANYLEAVLNFCGITR
jgi:predicted esterase YcpF (UPF0227 family)